MNPRARPILLVDDNPDEVDLAVEALQQYRPNNRIIVAADGAEALNFLLGRGPYEDRPRIEPAMVFVDWKTPKVDGLEVVRQIRAEPDLESLHIVLMTTSPEEAETAERSGLGVDGYVVKTLGFDRSFAQLRETGKWWVEINEVPHAE